MNPYSRYFEPAFPFVEPGDIAIDSSYTPIAVLTNGREWLHRLRPFAFHRIPYDFSNRMDLFEVMRAKDKWRIPMLLSYLAEHDSNRRLIELAFRAINIGNLSVFGPLPVMPDMNASNSSPDYDEQWTSLLTLASTGDCVFTRRTDSRLSRLIARIDDGSWSHVVSYGHDGWIADVGRGPGDLLVRIDEYRSRDIRVGLYRRYELLDRMTNKAAYLNLLSGLASPNYNLSSAIMAGVRAKLMIGDLGTPNGLIYRGCLYPVAFV